MEWKKLLSLRKQGDVAQRLRGDENEMRLSFEVDYDRVVFSEAFRSLQDKTQVIPLSKSGFVHTRLTHSMEVSVVGRSLGRAVGVELIARHGELGEMGYKSGDFEAIVRSAALAHDIGNPPFGHSGEKAIGDYFKNGKGSRLKELISEGEYADLCNFEGNANGFRILTRGRGGVEGGLRLTYATLGAFIKYPKESLGEIKDDISFKKYNFFQGDKDFFEEVAGELGLIRYEHKNICYKRHPLVWLVEAADDICYTIIDFEDGVNLGWIDERDILEYMGCFMGENRRIMEKYEKLEYKRDRVGYLRALAIGALVEETKRVFLENEEGIMRGEFGKSLLEVSRYAQEVDKIKRMSVARIYQSEEVISREIKGYEFLQKLLERYCTAVVNRHFGRETSFDKLVLRSVPKVYLEEEGSLYEKVIEVVCYVASMTDTQIVFNNDYKGFK